MNQTLRITDRDLVILRGLARCVRLFGQRQLADSLWNGDIANARRRLSALHRQDLLQRHVVLSRPIPETLGPLVSWRPGDNEPDFSQVAYRLQSRWRYAALRSTVVYLPTSACINHFAGAPRKLLGPQVSHDLGVAAVWLWYWRHHTDLSWRWRGEDLIEETEDAAAAPDAVLVDGREIPTMLVELGGDYSPERLFRFHDAAAARQLPYQVW